MLVLIRKASASVSSTSSKNKFFGFPKDQVV